MPSKHNLNVSVTEHLARFVADQVASGRYGSASEVVRSGLRLLERETGIPAARQSDGAAGGAAASPAPASPGGADPSYGKKPAP
jgi:antitoxin ParD1/3/4